MCAATFRYKNVVTRAVARFSKMDGTCEVVWHWSDSGSAIRLFHPESDDNGLPAFGWCMYADQTFRGRILQASAMSVAYKPRP
jgi:hypothetical protein